MKIRKLKRKADDLSREAWTERRRCAARSRHALEILRRRVGSPAGLALSFSLGFVVASLPGRRRSAGDEAGRRGGDGSGAVVTAASRLLAAAAARFLLSAATSAGAAES